MIERRILKQDEIPAEFFECSNVWNRYAEARFHHTIYTSGIEVIRKQGATVEDIDWIKSQLGGYNWELVNMHLQQHHKIAWCAYMFSQVYDIIKKPERLHEGLKPEVKDIFHPDNREKLMEQIRESTRHEMEVEAIRQEKIKSGKIVLPDPQRPYEVWIMDETENKMIRYKTARSREALAKSIEYAGLHPGHYKEAYCSGSHEDTRKFF